MTAPNHSDSQDEHLDEVLEIINQLARKSASGDYIYRGEPEHYDKVSSSLYRKLRYQLKEIIDVSEISVETIQNWMLDEAEKFTAYNPEIEGHEILAQLQHYGGETNLIDFTTDYLTALFFACDGGNNMKGRVIFLSKSGGMSKHIIQPSNPTNRIIAQKSVFVSPPKGYIEQFDIISIPRKLKQPILDYLRNSHGISTESIYNDLHGFIRVQALHQKAYAMLYAGITCRNNKDYEQAIIHYYEALTFNPQMAVAYNNLGNVYADIGKHDTAIQNYSKAIDLNPNYAGAYNNLGNVYADIGKHDIAIQNYSKTIGLDPNYVAAYNNRGSVYVSIGEYHLAIQDCSKAIDLDPNYAAAYNNRGNAYTDIGEYHLAIQDYSKAIALDPNYVAAYNNRGGVYVGIGEYYLAIQDYSKAIALDPNDASAYFNLGVAWLCISEWENAKSNLTIATNKGTDIKSDFNERYGSVAEFEQQYGIELPERIKILLA